MLQAIVRTDDDVAPLLLRLALAVVYFPHGAQKVLGWFGGYGLSASLGYMTHSGIPMVFAVLAVAAEFLGPLGLVTGLLTRVAALGIAVEMAVAVLMIHVRFGFFMNWTGQQKGEGFEFHLLAIAIGLALVVAGGGRFSLDRALTRRTA